jgi:taurine dehydrogenase large subunit
VETPAGQAAQRDFLLAELKAKLPALENMSVEHDWWGWVCLTADFLPHVYHALHDASVHYAIGYQGSGVSYALYAGKLLSSRIANDARDEPTPVTATPLPRFPVAGLRRLGQRAMYQWYRYLDNRG